MCFQSEEARLQLALQAKKRNPLLSTSKIARIYSVPRTTLIDRVNGKRPRRVTNLQRRKLTELEESTIVLHVVDLDSRSFSPRLQHVEDMANILLRERDAPRVGKNWASNFVKRTPELKTRLNRKIDYQRAFNEDPESYRAWFRLVANTIAKYGIQEEDIYNFDETGFLMGQITTGMVVTRADRVARPRQAQPGSREWTTVIQAVNSQGWAVPPYIIVAGKTHLASWYRDRQLPGNWVIQLSDNGWTTNEIAVKWLQHFDKHTRGRIKGTKRLLILDGHESHHSMEFDNWCKENNIIPLSMPAHSSHKLQPLDLTCFGPLKHFYGLYVERLMRRYQTHIAKEDFFPGFLEAYTAAMTDRNIRSGFEAAGIVPLNGERVIAALDHPQLFRTPTPPSDQPTPPWVTKTPTTTKEASKQSDFIKRRIKDHQNSSPTSILEAMDQMAKATHRVMHRVALLTKENDQLRETNHILSKRRRTKNKHLKSGGSLTIDESQVLLNQKVDGEDVESNQGESSHPRKRAATGKRRCGICGGTGHNARTCQADVETSNDEDSS